jgi:NAD(P)-dependent dehydrogenase (short-subunit alcohol dehydrogenase family)
MKNIIITGASKGIGKAIALKFAAHGFAIAACARNKEDLHALHIAVEELAPASDHIFTVCDVSDRSQLNAFADKIYDEMERSRDTGQ